MLNDTQAASYRSVIETALTCIIHMMGNITYSSSSTTSSTSNTSTNTSTSNASNNEASGNIAIENSIMANFFHLNNSYRDIAQK